MLSGGDPMIVSAVIGAASSMASAGIGMLGDDDDPKVPQIAETNKRALGNAAKSFAEGEDNMEGNRGYQLYPNAPKISFDSKTANRIDTLPKTRSNILY